MCEKYVKLVGKEKTWSQFLCHNFDVINFKQKKKSYSSNKNDCLPQYLLSITKIVTNGVILKK